MSEPLDPTWPPEPAPAPEPIGSPEPVGSPEPTSVRPAVHWPDRTGHATVDAALQAVTEVGGAPPVEQLPAYQTAHRSLRETLASIDEG